MICVLTAQLDPELTAPTGVLPVLLFKAFLNAKWSFWGASRLLKVTLAALSGLVLVRAGFTQVRIRRQERISCF